VASVGRTLASEGLNFFSDLGSARDWLTEIDVVFANGAVQYTPDPGAVLSQLVELEARELLFLRTAISKGDTQFTIQESFLSSNGPGGLPAGVKDRRLRYPRTFLAWQVVRDILSRRYQIEELPRDDREPLLQIGSAVLDPGWCARLMPQP
jgi:hypothetical protein